MGAPNVYRVVEKFVSGRTLKFILLREIDNCRGTCGNCRNPGPYQGLRCEALEVVLEEVTEEYAVADQFLRNKEEELW